RLYFYFDEIQNVPGWERFIRRLLDTMDAEIVITGSSARLLSRELATSLRGRSLATEIFPFSFREYLRHRGVETPGKYPADTARALLVNHLRSYLIEGGFPEVQGCDAALRTRILQDYLNVVILRDIVERHGVSMTGALRYLIRHLLNNVGAPFSVNRCYNDLRSQGFRVGKDTLHELLDHLHDAFLVFPIKIRSGSERARMVNPRKVYAVDTGLVRANSRSVTPDWGHLLENFVFLELRRRGVEIDYIRSSGGHEVDFIARTPDRRDHLIQVCWSLGEPATRARELRALEEAMVEYGLERGTIVSFDEEEEIETGAGRIDVVPAWRWAGEDGADDCF
ncbi:MAG: ATP-binding protein, partial [Pseudomonadota bacterium]